MSDLVIATRGGSLSDLFVQKLALANGAIAGSPFGGVQGVQISTNAIAPTNNQAEVVSDGSTGCVVAFIEGTTSAAGRIIAQRLSTEGLKQWGTSGTAVTSATQDTKVKSRVRILSDGSGGWWVAWLEARAVAGQPEIYVQHLSSSGTALLTADGVQAAVGATGRTDLRVCADGSGGIIVASAVSGAVRTQRIDSTGAKLWGSTEVTVRTGATTPWGELCPDGNGGAFFIVLASLILRLLRITSAGTSAFTEVIVSNGSIAVAGFFGIRSDGGTGCLVAWQQGSQVASPRTWTDTAQKFDAAGATQWSPSTGVTAGTSASTAITPQSAWRVETDGSGGIWIGKTNAAGNDVFVTRWGSGGTVVAQDLTVTDLTGGDNQPQIMSDGSGGLVVAWHSLRLGASTTFAQRITSGNVASWTTDGVLVAGTASDVAFMVGVEGAGRGAIQATAPEPEEEEEIVGGTLGTSADNIRWLTGDRDPANYAQKTVTIFQFLINMAQRLGARMGMGLDWETSVATLTSNVLTDGTLTIGADYHNVVVLRINATGRLLYRLNMEEINQLRDGLVSTQGQGDPSYFALYEDSTGAVRIRVNTVLSQTRTVDALVANGTTTEYLPTSTLPFGEHALRVLEKATALELMLRTKPEERDRIGFNPELLPQWSTDVEKGIRAEAKRKADLRRRPYAVGAVVG